MQDKTERRWRIFLWIVAAAVATLIVIDVFRSRCR